MPAEAHSTHEEVSHGNASLFVYVAAGRIEAVTRAFTRLRGVRSDHACWGRPDVITFVEASSQKTPCQLVLGRIQRVRGVETTDTRIVIEG